MAPPVWYALLVKSMAPQTPKWFFGREHKL